MYAIDILILIPANHVVDYILRDVPLTASEQIYIDSRIS